jgi:hypothetical protein
VEWAAEHVIKINPCKCKAASFTRARVKGSLNYALGYQLIPEASSCKYSRIIWRRDLKLAVHVNYTVKKVWKALHFTMRIPNEENSSTKCLAYMTIRVSADISLARPICRCRRAESTVSLERGVWVCAELQLFSRYRDWNEACPATLNEI